MVKGYTEKTGAFIPTLRPVWSSSENKTYSKNKTKQNIMQSPHWCPRYYSRWFLQRANNQITGYST